MIYSLKFTDDNIPTGSAGTRGIAWKRSREKYESQVG